MSKGVITKVKRLRKAADELLHEEIEREMYAVIERASVSAIVKCMGEVTVYDREGNSYDPSGMYGDKAPSYCNRLFELAELDIEYYSLTDHPLRLKKDAQNNVISTRDW